MKRFCVSMSIEAEDGEEALKKADEKIADKLNKGELLCQWEGIAKKCQECIDSGSRGFNFGFGVSNADMLFISIFPIDIYRTQLEHLISKSTDNNGIAWYCTSLIKCSVNTIGREVSSFVNRCFPVLKEQIDIINPKVIVCLGNYAGRYLLKTDKPLNWKTVYRYENYNVIVTAAMSDFRKHPVLYEDRMVGDMKFALDNAEKGDKSMVAGLDVSKGEDGIFVVEEPPEKKEPRMKRIDPRRKFIASFRADSRYSRNYVEVYAYEESEAERIVRTVYEDVWARLYESEEEAGVEDYSLRLMGSFIEIDGKILSKQWTV